MHTSNTEQKQLSTDIQEANKESLSKPETQLQQRQKDVMKGSDPWTDEEKKSL